MNNQRFNIYDEYNADVKFYKLPKVFFTSNLYSKLTSNSKIAWAVLRDRLELSKKNKWFDEKGDIYFRFSRNELASVLGVSLRTATDIRKNLLELNLLSVKKNGFNQSDNLYLQYPLVTDKDIYTIDKQESVEEMEQPLTTESISEIARENVLKRYQKQDDSTRGANFASQKKTSNSNDSTRSANFASQKKASNSNDSTRSANFAMPNEQNLLPNDTYSNNFETNETNETELALQDNNKIHHLHTKLLNEEQEILQDVFYKNHEQGYFHRKALTKILLIANYKVDEAEELLRICNNAKRNIEKSINKTIPVNLYGADLYCQEIIDTALGQYLYQVKRGGVINPKGYAYTVFSFMFIDIIHYQLQDDIQSGKINKKIGTITLDKVSKIADEMRVKKIKNQEKSLSN